MQTTLLSTKLYIPQPRGALVPRPRLIERLDAGLRGKLTLVSAPAGYGKTTLVSEWVYRMGGVLPPGDGTALPGGGRTLSLQAAWLSLDASDNDPARFFGYLIAALQQIDPRIGAGIQPVLEPGADLAVEQLLIALINDIAASGSAPTASPSAERGGFALILDDYHVISALEIHRALDFMLDHLPPPEDGGGMHIVLVSRADPPMPLGRLRVQRQLTEIREADLRFTPDETACLFQDVMGLDLSAAEIERLDARTEGWVAGLQLAALSVQDRADRGERIAAFGGSHRHLIEYLAHEVMARQTEQVRTFLLCTSILERFSASLCDAVLERSQSIEILEQLERANLFLVPLDGERQWYRYHHLFADFLKRRLQRTLPALVPELYARASEWYESQGLLDEAIEHALAGEDVGRAARLLDKHVESYILNAEVVRVRRWVERLPEEARCSLPRLCVYYAWALEFEFQLGAAETTMAQARPSASFPASQIAVHADALSVYTALHSGRYARAVELARAALAALPAPDADTAHPAQGTHPADREHPADDLLTVRGTVLLGLGIAALELGQMEVAYEALQSALPLNRRSGHRYGVLSCLYYMMWIEDARGALSQELATGERGLSWIELWSGAGDRRRPPARPLAHIRQQMGLVYYERDDLDRAAVYLRQASEYYELVGSAYRATSYAYLVDLYNALGDLEKARGSLQKLVRNTLTPGFSLPATPLPAVIAGRSLSLSRCSPELNDLFADAVRWADTSGLGPGDVFSYKQEYEYLTLARVRTAQGRAEEVLPLLERLVAGAQGAGAEDAARNGELIAYLSLQAVAYDACGRTDAALAALSRALALGEPEGYVRTFVDQGTPMADLLLTSRQRSAVSQAYVDRLLAAFGDLTKQSREKRKTGAPRPSSVIRRPSSALVEPLNDRELQILRLLAAGLSNRQIAEELFLSVNTVKWYTSLIYGKLLVNKRAKAVARAYELELL